MKNLVIPKRDRQATQNPLQKIVPDCCIKLISMERRYSETHKTWNKIAQFFENSFMDIKLYDDTYKRFCELIPKTDASVLEIGCGPGNITRYILELKPELKILATDISGNMVDLAKKNNPTSEVRVMDCRNIGTLESVYDAVICGFTIPYLSEVDCSNLISDISNLLTKEGVLYLSFVAGHYSSSGYISGSSGDRMYFYYHDNEKIKKEIELNSMTIVDIVEKDYKKSDGTFEKHIIINTKKMNNKMD